MTIPYNVNLPNPPDDPADDVPGMQVNTGSIATFAAVDHVGFNTPGGGLHQQVTFYKDNIPALPTPTDPSGNRQGILFSNNVGAGTVNQLFYYAGTAAQSSAQYVPNGTNGSTFLLGGIILKWGTISFTTSSQLVTFAGGGFINNLFAITLTALTTTPAINGELGYNPVGSGLTQFTAYQLTGNPLTVSYIAIGN